DILARMSDALAATGDYEEALKFHRLYAITKDSLLSQDIRLRVAQEETRREASLKEKQIELNSIRRVNEHRQRWLFGISAALLMLVIGLVWRNNARHRRANVNLGTANRQLADEKMKLELANERISVEKGKSDELAASLQESLAQKDALTARLS